MSEYLMVAGLLATAALVMGSWIVPGIVYMSQRLFQSVRTMAP